MQWNNREMVRIKCYKMSPCLSKSTMSNMTPYFQNNLPDNFIFKLFCTSPLPDTGQTVDVITVGQDSEPSLRRRFFFHHDIHTDSTRFVLTPCDGKRQLHVLLVFLYTFLVTDSIFKSQHKLVYRLLDFQGL